MTPLVIVMIVVLSVAALVGVGFFFRWLHGIDSDVDYAKSTSTLSEQEANMARLGIGLSGLSGGSTAGF